MTMTAKFGEDEIIALNALAYNSLYVPYSSITTDPEIDR